MSVEERLDRLEKHAIELTHVLKTIGMKVANMNYDDLDELLNDIDETETETETPTETKPSAYANDPHQETEEMYEPEAVAEPAELPTNTVMADLDDLLDLDDLDTETPPEVTSGPSEDLDVSDIVTPIQPLEDNQASGLNWDDETKQRAQSAGINLENVKADEVSWTTTGVEFAAETVTFAKEMLAVEAEKQEIQQRIRDLKDEYRDQGVDVVATSKAVRSIARQLKQTSEEAQAEQAIEDMLKQNANVVGTITALNG